MSRPLNTDPRRPLTLRDVSEASGVSEMTVSRVLRNRGDVSGTTRERVLEAARSLGYVPNKIAGALASQRVNLVGVVIPSLSNLVFPEVMTGISAQLEGTGLQPVVGVTNYLPDREEQVIYEMLSWRPSGLIVAGLEHTDAARAMMAQSGIPIVEIMDIDGEAVDSAVGISHGRAGRQMADAIIAAGYRKIAFLGTQMPNDHRARKRMEGFEAALALAGLKLPFQGSQRSLHERRGCNASPYDPSKSRRTLWVRQRFAGRRRLCGCLQCPCGPAGRGGYCTG